MTQVNIAKDRCKGCEFCIHFCPKNLLFLSSKLTAKGFHTASIIINTKKCSGCTICAQVCPDAAIEIEE